MIIISRIMRDTDDFDCERPSATGEVSELKGHWLGVRRFRGNEKRSFLSRGHLEFGTCCLMCWRQVLS